MNKFIIALLFFRVINFCNAQSLNEDKIYATQFGSDIYLDNQLDTRVKMIGNTTISILESNDDNQVTRELLRLSDSTFLYTEYSPLSFDKFLKIHASFGVTKEGMLVISNETMIDSTVMWNPETFETLASPRKRNVLKPIGMWFEIYNHLDKNYKVEGLYNSNGKHGEWNYYTNRRELDKILTFENGTLIKEKFINNLNDKSIEKTRSVIQGIWAYSSYLKTLSSYFTKYTSTFEFKQDGTLIIDGKKGTWSLIDYKTIEFAIHNKQRILKLEYFSDHKIRHQ